MRFGPIVLCLLALSAQDAMSDMCPRDAHAGASAASPAISIKQPVTIEMQMAALPIEPAGVTVLSDEELGGIEAGNIAFDLEDFNVAIQDNEAGVFTLDIAHSAFGGAQGVFTTLQAVNSAVDLTVIVNIYLNGKES
jgi:hypothetical protein